MQTVIETRKETVMHSLKRLAIVKPRQMHLVTDLHSDFVMHSD